MLSAWSWDGILLGDVGEFAMDRSWFILLPMYSNSFVLLYWVIICCWWAFVLADLAKLYAILGCILRGGCVPAQAPIFCYL